MQTVHLRAQLDQYSYWMIVFSRLELMTFDLWLFVLFRRVKDRSDGSVSRWLFLGLSARSSVALCWIKRRDTSTYSAPLKHWIRITNVVVQLLDCSDFSPHRPVLYAHNSVLSIPQDYCRRNLPEQFDLDGCLHWNSLCSFYTADLHHSLLSWVGFTACLKEFLSFTLLRSSLYRSNHIRCELRSHIEPWIIQTSVNFEWKILLYSRRRLVLIVDISN